MRVRGPHSPICRYSNLVELDSVGGLCSRVVCMAAAGSLAWVRPLPFKIPNTAFDQYLGGTRLDWVCFPQGRQYFGAYYLAPDRLFDNHRQPPLEPPSLPFLIGRDRYVLQTGHVFGFEMRGTQVWPHLGQVKIGIDTRTSSIG